MTNSEQLHNVLKGDFDDARKYKKIKPKKKPHNALVKNERNKTHFLLYTLQYRYQYFNEYEFYFHYFIVNLRYRESLVNQMSGRYQC